jgi:cytochrome b561
MMPRGPAASESPDTGHGDLVYAPAARRFHWWTAAFIAVQVPLGFYMVWRGAATGFDAMTGRLYDAHKLIGFALLLLVVARLAWRLRNGAPPDEPSLAWYERLAAHVTHWSLYALLVLVPLLGWLGVSLYGARSIFGLFSLPSLAGVDQPASEWVFLAHKWAAILMLAALAAHIGAAVVVHHVIRGDGVLRRMLPGLGKRVR